jgi:predicted restriction endonuclease
MKLSNFASFDPAHKKRSVKGLANASALDRKLWEEFEAAPNVIAEESEKAFKHLSISSEPFVENEPELPEGPTETMVSRPMRLVQSFFRRSVLASYGYKCSFCGLEVRSLLNASHIIPWTASVELRADPRNGLCLCSLHDRAFDRGLMSVDSGGRLLVSKRIDKANPVPLHRVGLIDLEGQPITMPKKFAPHERCLEHHRNLIFE